MPSIELSESTFSLLQKQAAEQGKDPSTFLADLVLHFATAHNGNGPEMLSEAEEERLWWESLSEEEKQAEREALDESLAAADAGRVTPAEVVYTRIRAKYAPRQTLDKAA